MNSRTHLDQAICRISIPKVCYGERLATWNCLCDLFLPDLHCKESDSTLFDAVRICFVLPWIKGRIIDFIEARVFRELIENITEGCARGKKIPKLSYGVCRLSGIWRRRGEGKIGSETTNAEETGSKGGALLVEGSGLGSSLVEESIVGCSVYLETRGGYDGFFAGSHRGHGTRADNELGG